MKSTPIFITKVLGFFKAIFQQQEGNNGLWMGFYMHLGIWELLQNAIEITKHVTRPNLFLQ